MDDDWGYPHVTTLDFTCSISDHEAFRLHFSPTRDINRCEPLPVGIPLEVNRIDASNLEVGTLTRENYIYMVVSWNRGPKWMLYEGKSPSKMDDDLGVPPWLWKPPYIYIYYQPTHNPYRDVQNSELRIEIMGETMGSRPTDAGAIRLPRSLFIKWFLEAASHVEDFWKKNGFEKMLNHQNGFILLFNQCFPE